MTESVIKYVTGDATQPQGDGLMVIIHVCNNLGGWGSGFTRALSKRWSGPEEEYRTAWHIAAKEGRHLAPKLGEVQNVQVEDKIWVVNMIAQHGFRRPGNLVPLKYEALEKCLAEVARFWAGSGASFHMPRIGCGLAGGDWDTVEHLVQKTLGATGQLITVYALP